MGLSQALSAALAGVTTTQQALSVISGNVANANTPGYVDESVNTVEVATAGQQGVSVDTTGINRNLNTLGRVEQNIEAAAARSGDVRD
jgi:flagellar hook-associated protein 1